MMKSFPDVRICIICMKWTKNRNSQLHFKPDICSCELYRFPYNHVLKEQEGTL